MEEATYLQEQDFETARHNAMKYNLVDASHGEIALFDALNAEAIFASRLADYYAPSIPFQALNENKPPLVASAMRPRFKQRTFPGKPLSDEDVVHANRIAGEIRDE